MNRPNTAPEPLCDEDEILAAVAQEPPSSTAPSFAAGSFQRLPPIYFIGDSRTIPFRNAVYVSEFTSRAYQLRSVHLRGLRAADFYSREHGINASLLTTLATDQTVISHDEGVRWIVNLSEFVMESDAAKLVLFCGPYDARLALEELGPDADIPAWNEVSSRYDVSTKPALRLMSADDVRARLLELMEPFALGIEALRAMGFGRIFIHGCPRTQRGERFSSRYGDVVEWLRDYHPNVLFKIHMLLDEVARSIAARTSARYVSGPADADGEIARQFTFDDVHYNNLGAQEVVRAVVAVVEGVVE